MSKSRFIVSLEIPDGATKRDIKDYIRSAVRCWCGSFDPDSPIFDLDKDSVTVKSVSDKVHSVELN